MNFELKRVIAVISMAAILFSCDLKREDNMQYDLRTQTDSQEKSIESKSITNSSIWFYGVMRFRAVST